MISICKSILVRAVAALPLLIGAMCASAQPNQTPACSRSRRADRVVIAQRRRTTNSRVGAQELGSTYRRRRSSVCCAERNAGRRSRPSSATTCASASRKWNSLAPEQRQQLLERFEKFKQLPPEQQERIRQAFKRFGSLPPEQRQHLREQFNQMSPSRTPGVFARRECAKSGRRASRIFPVDSGRRNVATHDRRCKR